MHKRAEKIDETRLRIIEAAVHLHGTIGPAATTIAGIADQAGVTRLTVYRHFPDEHALFSACSAQWISGQQLPDIEHWRQASDPTDRLTVGLTDLYRFYRAGAPMLAWVYRDKSALPEPIQQDIERNDAQYRDVLLEPFSRPGKRVRALVGHAAAFSTWLSLCIDHGLSNREAVQAITSLVLIRGAR